MGKKEMPLDLSGFLFFFFFCGQAWKVGITGAFDALSLSRYFVYPACFLAIKRVACVLPIYHGFAQKPIQATQPAAGSVLGFRKESKQEGGKGSTVSAVEIILAEGRWLGRRSRFNLQQVYYDYYCCFFNPTSKKKEKRKK